MKSLFKINFASAAEEEFIRAQSLGACGCLRVPHSSELLALPLDQLLGTDVL
jgi:hypothetical protein